MRTFITTVATLLIAGVFFLVGHMTNTAMSSSNRNVITVQGEGKISLKPDTAHITLGVQTGRQKTAADAMQALNSKMNAIVSGLKALKIDPKDIQNQQLSLNPSYNYTNGTQTEDGFEAMQNIDITVRSLDTVSPVIDAAVTAGANQVQNVRFGIDAIEKVQADARTAAIVDAKKKAMDLASALGVKLGDIVSYSDSNSGNPVPYPIMTMRAESVGAAKDMAVVPEGEQDIISNVTLQYEIK